MIVAFRLLAVLIWNNSVSKSFSCEENFELCVFTWVHSTHTNNLTPISRVSSVIPKVDLMNYYLEFMMSLILTFKPLISQSINVKRGRTFLLPSADLKLQNRKTFEAMVQYLRLWIESKKFVYRFFSGFTDLSLNQFLKNLPASPISSVITVPLWF